MASYPAPNPRNALYNQVDYVQNGITDQQIEAKLAGKLDYNNAQGLETFGSGIVVNGQATSNGLLVSNSGVDTIPNFEIKSTATLNGTNMFIGAGMAANSYNPIVGVNDAVISYGIAGGSNSGRLDICPVGTTGGVYFDSNGIAHAQYPIGSTANDNTLATTAFVVSQTGGLNGVQTDQDNTFLQPYVQTFTCSPTVGNTTAPFKIINSANTEYASLYLDPSVGLDMTLYSAQASGGLTIRNAAGNSFTVNPTTPNNTATFLNPIATSLGVSAGTLTVSTSGTINGSNIATEGRANVFTGINNFNANLDGATTSAQGLTIARNNETGLNELDLISLNSTSTTGLNIYAETTSVNIASTPKLTIYNDTTPALLNAGLTIATGATNPINLFTGNFQNLGSNLQTSGKFVAGGTLTVYNNNSGDPHWSNLTCPANNLEISTGIAITTAGQTNQVVLGTSASGLTVDDGIVATGQITGNNFLVNAVGQNPYTIYSNSTDGYGLVVANTSGGVGTLTLSNNSTTLTTLSSTASGLVVSDPLTATSLTLTSGGNTIALTTTASGLSVNDPITVPAQTYPLTSSSQVSTISYVNSAVSGATQQVRTGLTFTIPNTTNGYTYATSNTISSYTSTLFTTGIFNPSVQDNSILLNFNKSLYNGSYYDVQIQNVYITNSAGTSIVPLQFSVQSPTQLRVLIQGVPTFNVGTQYFFNINCVITST